MVVGRTCLVAAIRSARRTRPWWLSFESAWVGCVKAKRTTASPAEDLYVSTLFTGRRRYVERTCDRWFVLSAKRGLLEPTALVEPYDETLKTKGRLERRRWSESVLEQLDTALGEVGGTT